MKKAPSFAVTVPGLQTGNDDPKDDTMSSSSEQENRVNRMRIKKERVPASQDFGQPHSPLGLKPPQRNMVTTYDSPPQEKVTPFKKRLYNDYAEYP